MSVYREPEGRPPTPPTVIEYRTYALRLRGWASATVFAVIGLFVLSMIHATHLACTRRDGEHGLCVVSSYGLVVAERERIVPLADIVALDVTLKRSTKGPKTARVELRTSSERIDLAGGAPFDGFDYGRALDVQVRFTRFQSDPATPALDLWLHDGVASYVLIASIAAVALAIAGGLAREQLRQLRRIRIVVDHDRGVLHIGGREVPLEDVTDVNVEMGSALSMASGRGENILGCRVVVETRRGEHIAATEDFRAGNAEEHLRARAALRAALGARLEEAVRRKAFAKQMKKKKKRKNR